MPKRRRQSEEEQYHVEVISRARVTDEGDWEYYVKWYGYTEEDNSWEPDKNVEGCKRLLKSFWEHIGTDDNDYFPGHELVADQEWIDNEKEYFAAAFAGHLPKRKKKESSTESSEPRPNAGKAVKSKPKKKKTFWEYVEVHDEVEEQDPLYRPRKKKARIASDSSGSEESDVPLSAVRNTSSTDKGLAGPSKKGKEVERPQRQGSSSVVAQAASASRQDSAPPSNDPLFSAPPSPDAPKNKRALPDAPASAQDPGSTTPVLSKLTIPSDAPPAPPAATTPQMASGGPSKHLPSHREREMNPRVQMEPMHVVDKSGATSISTKLKIAQRAAVSKPSPSVPAAAPAPSAMESVLPQKPKSLANLTFKKKSAANPAPSASSPNLKGHASSKVFSNKEVVRSPVSMGPGEGSAWSPTMSSPIAQRNLPPPIPRPVASQPPKPPALTAAEQFLGTVMPEEMAAPMYEPMGDEPDLPVSVIPASISRKARAIGTAAPKKWKWTGELYMEVSPDKADHLCNISLSEPTDPRPLGLRLSILYTTDVSVLRLKKFHNISDLYLLLRACAPVQQCCKLSHATDGDLQAVSTLGAWMNRRCQFAYAHVYMDGDPVGLLIVFPSAIAEVCNLFKVPAHLKDQSSVLAALVPWAITVKQYSDNRLDAAHSDTMALGTLDPHLLETLRKAGKARTLLHKPLFAQGLRIHGFNANLYEFLVRTPRDYCLWHAPADGTTAKPGYETRALTAVLTECKAKDVGHKADVRVIFVHVGALPTLRGLQAVAMRRCKQPDLRIISYGTHHTVPPDRWGIREIYPLGGIITVTARALMEDPIGVYRIMKLADQHPLWMCYIHPYVVAALIRHDYPDSDPSTLAEAGSFFYSELLTFMQDGTVSLLYAPPLVRAPRLSHERVDKMVDPRLSWSEWLINLQLSEPQDMLVECVDMLQKAFPKVSDGELLATVEKALLADMGQMQLQPDIMDNYRRYVVITETRKSQSLEAEGVELTTASQFDFRDEYFSAR